MNCASGLRVPNVRPWTNGRRRKAKRHQRLHARYFCNWSTRKSVPIMGSPMDRTASVVYLGMRSVPIGTGGDRTHARRFTFHG